MPKASRAAADIPFASPYRHGFVRLAACVPTIALADPIANAAETLKLVREGHQRRAAVMVFPELGLCGYSIDDLLLQDALLGAVETAIGTLVEASRDLGPDGVYGTSDDGPNYTIYDYNPAYRGAAFVENGDNGGGQCDTQPQCSGQP